MACFVSAYIFDITEKVWTYIASMSRARHSHACGVVNNDVLLVGGGKDDFGDLLTSVEIFFSIEMKWQDSTPLPSPLSSEASLQYGNTVLVFGRRAVYQFDETSFKWSVREESLSSARSYYLAIPLTGT